MMIDIQVTENELSSQECERKVAHPGAGGTVVFIGTVRDQTKGKAVQHLEFESYVPMAMKEMRHIAQEMEERWNVIHVCIHHRIGKLAVGEIPVIIAVSTPHRKAAFEACEYAIDTLKQSVPIWKKEVFEDGEQWVSAHP